MVRELSPSDILKDSTKSRANHGKRESIDEIKKPDDLKNTVIVRNEKELLEE